MSNNVNRADVQVNFRDVFGQPIKDEVEVIFKNQQVSSLSQKVTLKLSGDLKPVIIPGVPAFPVGRAEVIIKPNKYRFKSIFVNVLPGVPNAINEIFFV